MKSEKEQREHRTAKEILNSIKRKAKRNETCARTEQIIQKLHDYFCFHFILMSERLP